MDNLLDSHAFKNSNRDLPGQITIENLTVGEDYQVQLFFIADDRSFIYNSLVRLGNGAGVISGPILSRESFHSVVGRFTADSTSQTILMGPVLNSGAGLSGMVVQEIPEFEVLLGDCNLDGVVNFLDISPFILTLLAGEYLPQADTNEDGAVNFLDINPLILLLSL